MIEGCSWVLAADSYAVIDGVCLHCYQGGGICFKRGQRVGKSGVFDVLSHAVFDVLAGGMVGMDGDLDGCQRQRGLFGSVCACGLAYQMCGIVVLMAL